MEHELVRINKVLPEILKKTSPTFCLAKWHHVTMYLHLGETHSCYHPPPHEIPLDELKDNPSALHNTKQKKLKSTELKITRKLANFLVILFVFYQYPYLTDIL